MKAVIVSGIVSNVTEIVDDYFKNSEHTNEEAFYILMDISNEMQKRIGDCKDGKYIDEEED